MSREAMKLALEALGWTDEWRPGGLKEQAITALRKALAEQPAQQKPVAWMDIDENGTFSGLRYWSESDNRHEVALYTSPPAQRKPLTLEEIDLLINGRGEPDDDDYVEPIGDGFGLSDADLVRLVRKTEAAHNIKENT